MLRSRSILGISITMIGIALAMIGPVASADDDQQKNEDRHCQHDDQQKNDERHCQHDDDKDDVTTGITAQKCPQGQFIVGIDASGNIICAPISSVTVDPGNTGNTGAGNSTTPTAVYAHIDVGTCTTDPITSVSYGWCPDGIKFQFFIHDANVTRYSVIAVTTVPPITNPLSTVQCGEQSINYTVGANQGFGILCNYSPLPGSGLNYVIFNPSPAWYVAHNIKP